jgi:Lecithin retinol acyltransferase
MSRLGEGNYHLIFNNCQHFARWCATGDHESEQLRSVAATTGTIAAPAAAAALTTSAVGSAGSWQESAGQGSCRGWPPTAR